MSIPQLNEFCTLDDHAKELLQFAMTDRHLSALTIADLANSDRIIADHIGEAIQLRALDRQIWGLSSQCR